jgi:hypothetical protein
VNGAGLARILVACTQLMQLKSPRALNRLHPEGILLITDIALIDFLSLLILLLFLL